MSSSLIQTYMPEYKMRQIDRIRVKPSSTRTWEVVRSLDTQSLPMSKLLFGLRSLPHRLTGRTSKPLMPKVSKIEDFTGPGKGFQVLEENPGQEIVIASVGKFWKLDIEWAFGVLQKLLSSGLRKTCLEPAG